MSPESYVLSLEEYRRCGDLDRFVEEIRAGLSDDELGQAVVFEAICRGDAALLGVLERMGIRLSVNDSVGVPRGHIHGALQQFGDAPQIVRRLVDCGVDPNERFMNDWTPLHLAASMGFVSSARELIACGADVNAVTAIDGGWTPLMEAAAGGHAEAVQVLLSAGANPGIVNGYEGADAREIARRRAHEEVVRIIDLFEKEAPWRGKRARRNKDADRNP
jgi:ankyrin repeat protein